MTDPMQAEREADLHARIMNLPCNVPETFANEGLSYKLGHRDARHAAAELAAEHASELRSLRDSLALAKAALMEKAERIDDLKLAMQRLCRSFPTDEDMDWAGWDMADINEACDAYEAARAALNKEQP